MRTVLAVSAAEWPASIVNTNVRKTYYAARGGLLLDPERVDFYCIYNDDGSRLARSWADSFAGWCVGWLSYPRTVCMVW